MILLTTPFTDNTVAASLFRVCILWRTWPLRSSKASPLKRPSKVVSTFVKWDGLGFRAFPGCWFSHPYPYVTISAAEALKSDDLRHAMLAFSFFPSLFFLCAQRILRYWRSQRMVAVHPPFLGCIWRSLWIGTAFTWRCDVTGLQMLPLKDADPKLWHSKFVQMWFVYVAPHSPL